MSFASDRLYNGYLRRNMPTIVSSVKVREITVHLPCLTTHDRENIEAKRETSGNYDGMVLLLECLRRRENWPEQFIQALEACEHRALAAEIRQEYDSLRGVNNFRAHVHPAPAANHLPALERGVRGQPAEAPPGPAAQAPPPVETPAQQPLPQVEAVAPPEPISEPPTQDKVPLLPSTPPPSPEIQHAEAADALLPQDKDFPHQEPEENSESEIQGASGAASSVPQKMSSGKKEAAVTAVTSPQQQQQRVVPDPLQTAVASNDQPQQSSSLTPVNTDVSDGSSLLTLTPEKHPVQDTAPPVHKVPTPNLQPQKSPEHAAVQTLKSEPQTEATSTNKRDVFHENADDNTMCLSKPCQLISIHPENPPSPPAQTSNSPVQPYSGNSERLEISEAASDAETHHPVCAAVGPKVEESSAQPCQENGISPDHSEPEENHYESPNQSFEVVENVVQVTELPSILNLDGQAPQIQIINGEATTGSYSAFIGAADDGVSSLNSHHSESYSRPEPTGAGVSAEPRPLPNSEKTTPHNLSDGQSMTRKYILIGAGLGACALLIALKFRK